jgi:hypothetical protein
MGKAGELVVNGDCVGGERAEIRDGLVTKVGRCEV